MDVVYSTKKASSIVQKSDECKLTKLIQEVTFLDRIEITRKMRSHTSINLINAEIEVGSQSYQTFFLRKTKIFSAFRCYAWLMKIMHLLRNGLA